MAAVFALPFAACATTSPPPGEVEGLRSEVVSLRARQAEQDREIARLRAELASRNSVALASESALSTRRAEASVAQATPAAPRVPENLKVVYVQPDPVEYRDPAPTSRAATPRRTLRPVAPPPGAPTPLPTDTALREPVSADESPQTELLRVAYQAALTAPDGSALEQFARAHPEAPQADNALFEAGLRAERSGQADRAAKNFERAVGEHPAGDVVADALLHLAACQLQLHRTEAARATLSRITSQFPGTAQAEAAQVRLTDLSP